MRLFIAANIPEEVLRDLNGRVSQNRSRLPAASWVRPETQHVTFAFLGEQPQSLIEAMAQPLATSVTAIDAFEARLSGCGVFPNARHARVGWVGLQPEDGFARIAAAVRAVVAKSGVESDTGEFRPHLTLMRMRDRWPPASIDLFCRILRDYQSAPFRMEKVTLFSSELHPKGAIHTPLRAFALSGSS